jgi:DNA damage-binding protein 1
VAEVPIFGRIVSLSHYRPHGSAQDVLYILTAKKFFCVLGYDAASGRITSRATGNLRDRVGRDSPHGPRGFLDPDGRMIAMILYDRTLKVDLLNIF